MFACPQCTATPETVVEGNAALAIVRHGPVQRMLGHAKASMTLDVYADLFDADLDAVAANLDEAIKSAADPLRTMG